MSAPSTETNNRSLPACSVVVPTYHRPSELERCLRSLIAQTVRPAEIIVVDDGNLTECPAAEAARAAGIPLRLIRKERPGLTESRREGVRHARGEVILFVDDDTEFSPDFLARILAIYAVDEIGEVGGVSGVFTNRKKATFGFRVRHLIQVACGASGFREGRLLRSGACVSYGTTPAPLQTLTQVDFLDGSAMSFRREVFDEYAFTPRFREFAFGEDKDFTLRVSQRYRLLIDPAAHYEHYQAEPMRPEPRTGGRKKLLARYLLFRDCVPAERQRWILFGVSLIGYLGSRLLVAVVPGRKDARREFLGMLDGVRMILRGTVPRPGKSKSR